MSRRFDAWIVLLALAGGCSSLPQTGGQPASNAAAAGVNLSGFSSAFRQGYAAGCDSAKAGVAPRDEGRYRADTDYKLGWNDGYSICAPRK